jgi:uncharacterized protein YecT (DUF1311 family)
LTHFRLSEVICLSGNVIVPSSGRRYDGATHPALALDEGNRRVRLTGCIVIVLFGGGEALADPCADVSEHYSAIGEEQCAENTFAKADASLNEAYQKVVRHLKEQQRDLAPLIVAERAWIVERDARCDQKAKESDLIDATGAAAILDCKTE